MRIALLHAVVLPAIITASLLPSAARAQQPDTLIHSLFNPGTSVEMGTKQGYRVAVDGNYAVVGASLADAGAANAGVARVYDAQTGALLHTLNNPSPASGDQFGVAVAISGNLVAVGASLDNAGAIDAGAVYIYDLTSARPTTPVAVLEDPGLSGADHFGTSLAISGRLLAVGAPLEDFVIPATGDTITNSGRVYVYDLSGAAPFAPVAVLDNPTPARDDQFGGAVAIWGSRVVVGASRDDAGERNAGAAYVYDLASATPQTPAAVLNNPSPASGDQFGFSVAISGDRVVVGAHLDDTVGLSNVGSAYIYDLSSATPSLPVRTLNKPFPTANDQFGYTVAVSGNRVVVGVNLDDFGLINSGSAYVYDLGSATPGIPDQIIDNPTPATNDQFAASVAIAGTRVVVGASLDDTRATNAGSAYTYDLAGANPVVPVAVLNDPSPASSDQFGGSVAISGSLVVVGASRVDVGGMNTGRAYVYDFASATPTVPLLVLDNPSPNTNDQFGSAVAISGRRVVVAASLDDFGATNSGSVFIYDLDSAAPAFPILEIDNPTPAANDQFGNSVAISGNIVAVGARYDEFGAINAGRAYAFNLASATPAVPVAVFNNPAPGRNDQFGNAVAVSGSRVVVGAYLDDADATNAGRAYVFDLSSLTPTVPSVVLSNPKPGAFDQFGVSVAISGARVVVAANLEDTGANSAGTAYVFDLASAAPEKPAVVLHNPSPGSADRFGSAVSISGDRIVVGVTLDNAGATDSGSAYVFDLGSATPIKPVAVLTDPSPSRGDQFGAALGIDGVNVVVAARLTDAVAYDRGAVFIFGPGNPPMFLLGTGSPATGGDLPPGSTFASFTPPDVVVSGGKVVTPDGARLDTVFNSLGVVLVHSRQVRPVNPGGGGTGRIARLRAPTGDAVLATLVRDGIGATAANDVVLFTGLLSGTPLPAARKGQDVPGAPGVKIRSFINVDGNGTTTFFSAKLKGIGVRETNSTAVFGVGPGGLRLLVRQGMPVASRVIRTVTTLVGDAGTLSEGRWRSGPDELGVRVGFVGGGQAIYLVPASAAGPEDWVLVSASGEDAAPELAGAKLEQFGLPGYGPGATIFQAQLQVGPGDISRRNRFAVFDTEGFDFGGSSMLRTLLQLGEPVPSPFGGARNRSHLVRVRSVLAGLERASTTIADAALSQFSPAQTTIFEAGAEGVLVPIARIGDPAPGGGIWQRFLSVAKPDGPARGALILAVLEISPGEGLTAKNRTALYAVDGNGYLRRMLRTGDSFESAGPGSPVKTVANFSALTAASGSNGAARGYDSNGNVAALVTFTDRTQAIVKLRVP